MRAVEDNARAWLGPFAHLPGAEAHDDPDVPWVVTDVALALCNSVLFPRLDPDEDADARIDALLAAARDRGVGQLWWLGAHTRPRDLEARLDARGLTTDETSPGMSADLRDVPDVRGPDGLRIEPVTDAAMLDDMLRPFAAAFGMPAGPIAAFRVAFTGYGLAGRSLRHYVGYLDGEPVGAASILRSGDVAGLYNVAAAPHRRGLGIGAAMSAQPLLRERERGARTAVLEATEDGLPVYRRLGFEQVGEVRVMALEP